ncbi:hypothetical protein TNCV_2679611 [Trichonephila clavipes]|nr:hypothetical protein TNCV_2679611 [Trichonephila clavipes]
MTITMHGQQLQQRHHDPWSDEKVRRPDGGSDISPCQKNGVLYRKIRIRGWKVIQVAISTSSISYPRVLKVAWQPSRSFRRHENFFEVRERFFWGKVRADVEQWCKSCDACSARKGPKIRSRGSCIATMLEHPSNVSLSISWDLCQGLRLVISTYLLSLTTSRNGPKCTPFGSGSPHRSGGL